MPRRMNIVHSAELILVTKRPRQRKPKPPSEPTPRATQRRQALRESLIEAAERAIGVHGIAGVNARDLARAVGSSLGAIYNVFPHLDAIVFEVNSRTLAMFEAFVAKRGKVRWEDIDREAAIIALVGLAEAYLDFAVSNQPRWRAIFEQKVSAPGGLPKSYLSDQARLFTLVERPLAVLRPELDDRRRMLFARTMFSAVHGIVSLSLDAKLVSLPIAVVGGQLRAFVGVLGRGLLTEESLLGRRALPKKSSRA